MQRHLLDFYKVAKWPFARSGPDRAKGLLSFPSLYGHVISVTYPPGPRDLKNELTAKKYQGLGTRQVTLRLGSFVSGTRRVEKSFKTSVRVLRRS